MFHVRLVGVVTALVVLASVPGCGSNRSVGWATYGTGTPAGNWSRDVTYSVDGAGTIASKETTATITFSGGRLVIEKARILLNDEELARVPEDAKAVDVDYTAGILRITADGNKVHDARLAR